MNNLGEVYYWMRQHDKALEVLQPALVIRQQLKDKVGKGETLDNIGLTYYGKQEDKKALEDVWKVLNFKIKQVF